MRVPFMRQVSWYLVFAMFIIGIAPRAEAGFSPSGPVMLPHFDRARDMNQIERVLEGKMVSKRLQDLGFSPSEIKARLSRLSDAQLHMIASKLSRLKTGGDGLGVIIAVLIIALLVIVILQLTGHRVLIK